MRRESEKEPALSRSKAGHREGCDPTVRCAGETVTDEEASADYPGNDCRDPKEG